MSRLHLNTSLHVIKMTHNTNPSADWLFVCTVTVFAVNRGRPHTLASHGHVHVTRATACPLILGRYLPQHIDTGCRWHFLESAIWGASQGRPTSNILPKIYEISWCSAVAEFTNLHHLPSRQRRLQAMGLLGVDWRCLPLLLAKLTTSPHAPTRKPPPFSAGQVRLRSGGDMDRRRLGFTGSSGCCTYR